MVKMNKILVALFLCIAFSTAVFALDEFNNSSTNNSTNITVNIPQIITTPLHTYKYPTNNLHKDVLKCVFKQYAYANGTVYLNITGTYGKNYKNETVCNPFVKRGGSKKVTPVSTPTGPVCVDETTLVCSDEKICLEWSHHRRDDEQRVCERYKMFCNGELIAQDPVCKDWNYNLSCTGEGKHRICNWVKTSCKRWETSEPKCSIPLSPYECGSKTTNSCDVKPTLA
jgi:hypothetical protein